MLLSKARTAVADLFGGLVIWIPGGIGSRLRIAYYRLRGARIGSGTRIDPGVMIDQPHRVDIGADTWLDRYAVLIAGTPRGGRETRVVGRATEALGMIRIGRRCHIGVGVILSGIGGVTIHDEVTLAAGTKVYSLTHHYRSWRNPSDSRIAFGSMVPPGRQSMLQGEVTIGANVGIGVDCLILPGVVIGANSFVRPRSIVSATFGPNSLVSGNPASLEGERFPTAAP